MDGPSQDVVFGQRCDNIHFRFLVPEPNIITKMKAMGQWR
jgi:hypothetical protein